MINGACSFEKLLAQGMAERLELEPLPTREAAAGA